MTLKTTFQSIENYPLTLTQWVFGFAGVLFVRFLLENISNQSSSGALTSDASTLIHYYLFYLLVALSLGLILHFLSGKSIAKLLKLILFGLVITWLPPIIDLIITGGEGSRLAYMLQPWTQLWHSYLSFFGPLVSSGISIGIRVEVLLVSIGTGLYIFTTRRSIIRSVLGAILSYTAIFIAVSLPSIINFGTATNVIGFIASSLENSIISQNFLHPTITLSETRSLEIFFNSYIAQLFYILSTGLLAIIAWRNNKQEFLAILRNSRASGSSIISC